MIMGLLCSFKHAIIIWTTFTTFSLLNFIINFYSQSIIMIDFLLSLLVPLFLYTSAFFSWCMVLPLRTFVVFCVILQLFLPVQ